MSGPRPSVSVGIPTYNGVERLRGAVDSVLAQDHPGVEIVISDNGSTDGTEAYGRALQAEHPDAVRYLRNDRNLGPTENFRRVRAACTGEFVMWLGDDDRLGPGYLSACVALLAERPDAAVAAGAVRYADEGRDDRVGDLVQCDQADPLDRVLAYYRQVGDNSIFYGVTRQSVAERVAPLAGVIGADWYLMAEVAFAGPILFVDGVELVRRSGGTSRSLKHAARSLGFTWIEGEFPQLVIAGLAFRELAWSSPAYARLGRIERLSAAVRAAAIVVRRFVVPAVPRYLRLLGRRIRGVDGA